MIDGRHLPGWVDAVAWVSIAAALAATAIVAIDIVSGTEAEDGGDEPGVAGHHSLLRSCGAGCTIVDFAGEWLVFLTGLTMAGSVPWAVYAWFSMQIAMAVGFATAFPANWWLIRAGIKEAM